MGDHDHHQHHQKELQLLPPQLTLDSNSLRYRSTSAKSTVRSDSDHHHHQNFRGGGPRLGPGSSTVDLQLSISLISPIQAGGKKGGGGMCEVGEVEAVKWQAAEQIRLAAMEKEYAESVREMTRREMEMAQSEFARARHMWERAREEVEKAERMRERATKRIDSTCMEITCHSCRQRFQI